jgi:hypothetical protein
VDPHAEAERDAPQPARQPRRLDGRGDRVEHAGEVRRRAGAARHLLGAQPLERVDPVRLARGQDAVPRADVRRRRRGPQEAAAAIVGRDPVLVAEGADRVDRGRGRAAQPDRLLRPAAGDEARQLRPPREHHAAVAARCAAAADVALEHDHVTGGIALLELDRRPQPDEAAAEDRDVGPHGALERWLGRRVAQGLAQPQRTMRRFHPAIIASG